MTSLATRAWVPLAFFLAMAAGGSDASWCVCRQELSDAALQKTLDYACGDGADCVPINQNGACYNPNTVKAHCSYAVNSYYQKRGQAQQACDFAGTASVTQQDPSANGCTYPASSSAAGSSSGGNNGFNTGFGTARALNGHRSHADADADHHRQQSGVSKSKLDDTNGHRDHWPFREHLLPK
ncbi:hypothetical protein HPP92_011939 [Vanilla planifolia]|uniref:X8 domain-containing protein n=1 Tax=Vanilla planifolia TaxID=51239 RepID=A0A835R9F8_VANPL|nr:hypothetical protein HPP92_012296 [Vanilla planifolia]KAG0483855.1 hypothetical protein HPP92_011939 [Vanilla planifolia]